MGEDKVVRDVESYTDNELAVSQIRVLKRIAAAMERHNEMMDCQIKKLEADRIKFDTELSENITRRATENLSSEAEPDLPVGTVVEAGTGKRVNKLGLDFEKKGRGSK